MDAIHIKDGAQVVLKRVDTSRISDEADIGRFLSSDSCSSHANNYCVPVHDVLSLPDNKTRLIVMPHLWDWGLPPMNTIGEAVEFFRQAFVVSPPHHPACVSFILT